MTELTDAQVEDIRRRFATSSTIGGTRSSARLRRLKRFAEEYGVSPACIDAIVKGRQWRHLQEQRPELPLKEKKR